MSFVGQQADKVEKTYTQDRIKCSTVNYSANKLTVTLENADKKKLDIVFQLSNNDIAFRYEMPQYGETACMVIEKEATGFDFPSATTTFLSPQSDPMIGWMRTKPSYEEEYVPMNRWLLLPSTVKAILSRHCFMWATTGRWYPRPVYAVCIVLLT